MFSKKMKRCISNKHFLIWSTAMVTLTIFLTFSYLQLIKTTDIDIDRIKINKKLDRKVAVCISGYRAENLLHQRLYESHIKFLNENDADLFVYASTTLDQTEDPVTKSGYNSTFNINVFKLLYKNHLQDFKITKNDKELNDELLFLEKLYKLPNVTRLYKNVATQFLKIQKCYNDLLKPHELKRGNNYEWIAYFRPDLLQLKGIGPINDTWDKDSIYFPGRNSIFDCNWSDAVCKWRAEGNTLGLLDTSFIASHSYFHYLANVIDIYAGNHRYHLHNKFPESILYYIVKDTFKFKTLPIDMKYQLDRLPYKTDLNTSFTWLLGKIKENSDSK